MVEGKFLVFEGPDGSGKSTQAKMLAEHLKASGKNILAVREPGGTKTGERIREILLDPKLKMMSAKTELLLFMAARSQLVSEVIRPALEQGTYVISDRFLLSTLVYQGVAGGESIDEIKNIARIATDNLEPNITFLVDVPTEIGMKRVGKNKDRMESKGFEFHKKIREGYLSLAEGEKNTHIIDGTKNISEIHEKIRGIVENEFL